MLTFKNNVVVKQTWLFLQKKWPRNYHHSSPSCRKGDRNVDYVCTEYIIIRNLLLYGLPWGVHLHLWRWAIYNWCWGFRPTFLLFDLLRCCCWTGGIVFCAAFVSCATFFLLCLLLLSKRKKAFCRCLPLGFCWRSVLLICSILTYIKTVLHKYLYWVKYTITYIVLWKYQIKTIIIKVVKLPRFLWWQLTVSLCFQYIKCPLRNLPYYQEHHKSRLLVKT